MTVLLLGYGREEVPLHSEGGEAHVFVALREGPIELIAFVVTGTAPTPQSHEWRRLWWGWWR